MSADVWQTVPLPEPRFSRPWSGAGAICTRVGHSVRPFSQLSNYSSLVPLPRLPPPPTRLYCPSAPSPGSHLPLRTPRGAGCLVRNHIIPEHSFAPSGSPRLLSLNFTVSSRSPSPHKLSFSAILSLPYNTSQTATAVPSIPRGQRSPFPDASRGFDPRARPAARRLASRRCARAPRPQARRACALGAAPPPGLESPDLPEAPGEPPGAAAARGWAVGRAAGLGRASGR